MNASVMIQVVRGCAVAWVVLLVLAPAAAADGARKEVQIVNPSGSAGTVTETGTPRPEEIPGAPPPLEVPAGERGAPSVEQRVAEKDLTSEQSPPPKKKRKWKKVWISFHVGGGALFYAQTLVQQYNNLMSVGQVQGRFQVRDDLEILVGGFSTMASIQSTRPSIQSLWAGIRLGLSYTPFPHAPFRFSIEVDETGSLLTVSDKSFGYLPLYRTGVSPRLMFGWGKNWWTSMYVKWAPVTGRALSQSEVSGGISLYYLWPKRLSGWVLSFEGSRLQFVDQNRTAIEQVAMTGTVGYIF